jgi:hypothetical protein
MRRLSLEPQGFTRIKGDAAILDKPTGTGVIMTSLATRKTMKLFTALSLFVVLTVSCIGSSSKSANETPLPKAPDGYMWERFSEIQSAFLCPTGWHRFDKAGLSSHTYVISKESVATNGVFETGLTMQAIKSLQKKKGMPPSVLAIQMAQGILGQRENKKLSTQDVSSGPFRAFFIRYRNAPEVAKPIVIHQVFIANDKKDTLFIVTFEAPEKSWDEAWRIGEPMVKKFLIDDEY